MLVDLLIEGLEEYLNTAEKVLDVVVRSEILAVAIAQRCNDVLERSVVRADFPALLTSEDYIERGEQIRVLAEVAVSCPSTPSALVLSLSPLVAVLSAPRLVEVISDVLLA